MNQRTVLITGASSGIGGACVSRQAKAGWKVYAGVRKVEDGERLTSEVGGDVIPVILDVTKREDIDRVLVQIDTEVGKLDGLVNNAGATVGGAVELLTDEEWRWQFDVNFFSVMTLSREALPLVSKADGRLVHIGSISGRISAPGAGPYAATKHAVSALNWSLRAELARNTKMTSSVIEPGVTKTTIWEKADETMAEYDARLEATGTRDRYGFLLEARRGLVEEAKEKGIDPDRVAKAVEHALTAARPKARYLVGPDAKAGAFIARLPDRAREALLNINRKKLERAGRQ